MKRLILLASLCAFTAYSFPIVPMVTPLRTPGISTLKKGIELYHRNSVHIKR